jgi:phosphatidylglycerol---prolipoprotein diacylglyceryl transferase
MCPSLPIHGYGVLLALAFLGGIVSGIYHGRKLGFRSDHVLDLAIWFMIGAMGGARVLYIVLYPDQFPTVGSWFAIHKGGLVFYGGFIGTVLVVLWYGMRNRYSWRDMGDFIAPSLAVGHLLGRLGCFWNKCCFGRATDFFLGCHAGPDMVARHPTQLYEATYLGVLLILTSWMVGRRTVPGSRVFPGAVWGVYVLAYAPFRFFNETLRDDDRGGVFGVWSLSISQWISLLAIAGAVLWLVLCYLRRHLRPEPPKPGPAPIEPEPV